MGQPFLRCGLGRHIRHSVFIFILYFLINCWSVVASVVFFGAFTPGGVCTSPTLFAMKKKPCFYRLDAMLCGEEGFPLLGYCKKKKAKSFSAYGIVIQYTPLFIICTYIVSSQSCQQRYQLHFGCTLGNFISPVLSCDPPRCGKALFVKALLLRSVFMFFCWSFFKDICKGFRRIWQQRVCPEKATLSLQQKRLKRKKCGGLLCICVSP